MKNPLTQSWDLERVLEWLISEELSQHCSLFEENHLNGAALMELTKVFLFFSISFGSG